MIRVQPYKCVLKKDGRVLHVAESTVSSPDQAASIARAYLAPFPHEEVIAILLSGTGAVTGIIKIGQGGLHACALTPADVFRPVLVSGASAFILAHNHPGGDPTPSASDVDMTKALRAVADLISLPFHDHIVVAPNGTWRSIVRELLGEASL